MGSKPSSFYEQSTVRVIRQKRTKPTDGDGKCLVEVKSDDSNEQKGTMSDRNTHSRLPPIGKPREPHREVETRLLNDVSEPDMSTSNESE